ncbi:homoserine O-succinyltransferase [Sphingosinicella sp. CPCC 101087]|uniref:homoserine O-succinyltransferase MetX n=1 Tax=Sphingosinicella sp. CPCC 101087 TaxID=2497754 RepID=UPI0013EB5233|nr:homoserine O-succinyltransferase [Sphingosinicella sp. CPCC 101087]
MKLLDLKAPKTTVEPRPARQAPPLAEFELPLPAPLAGYGSSALFSLHGRQDGPLIAVLGGISADRFPAFCPDGRPGWWRGLAGPGCAVDPARHRILGMDFIADPTGARAPATHEQAAILCAALDFLGVERAHAVVGASYGGMIALALGQHFPERVERLTVVSADAQPHPASTAARELQRRIVALGLETGDPDEALSIARGLAMMTYRTREEFAERFEGGIPSEQCLDRSEPGAYLRARGAAFVARMTPQRFLSLSASIDRHKVDPARIRVPALLIGADSDQLVPAAQMEKLAAAFGGPAELRLLASLYGHDMFLKDSDRVSALVDPFLRKAA